MSTRVFSSKSLTSQKRGRNPWAGCLTAFLFLAAVQGVLAQSSGQIEGDRLGWWKSAKLGIFIHWGYYAVNGITESWSIWNKQISHHEYMEQASGFTAARYDPQAWADLFREAGARYAVLTSKHHDGVCLWDTRLTNLNVARKTPAKRDLIGPYCEALRRSGLKVGLYFSLCDWSHPDYTVPFSRANAPDGEYHTDDYPQQHQGQLSPWDRFLLYYKGQVRELSDRYRPDIFWFDGDWEHTALEWRAKELRDSILSWNNEAIINSRLQGYGDYQTPEQDPPLRRLQGPWELCMTINDNWGYQPSDTNFKSSREIIRIFVECLAGGGNLLLDIGPKPDGTIPQQEVDRLKDLGKWIHGHEEAVYGTIAGIGPEFFYGPTTVSADSQTVYLYVLDSPKEFLALKGIKNRIRQIREVGSGRTFPWIVRDSATWNDIPGIVLISVPADLPDPFVNVLAVELEGPLNLYSPSSP
jgi:alpha-L-fucosidase